IVVTQCILIILMLLLSSMTFADNFTAADRERLIRLETKLETALQQIDKRFEQIDKRFEDLFTFLWILTGIFTTLTLSSIGFAYWDRRTAIRKAKEETIATIEREGSLVQLINALRELAKKNKEVARVLRMFNLL
ncbi:MAG: hypothetical protein QHH74_16055, partial [Spirochaetota bacterium]|nr:hypothetical protein [Spirochaetota bacterium]